MKRTLLIGLLLSSVSAFAYMGGHDRMNSPMFDDLNLTKEQKTQLKTIRKESRDEQIKLMDAMDDLRDKTQERIMGVLNKEQQARYMAMKKQMRMHSRQNRDDRKGGYAKMSSDKPSCGRQ